MKNKTRLFLLYIAACFFILPSPSFAAGPPVPQDISNPMVQLFIVVIILLAICIALLAHVLTGAAEVKVKQMEEAKKENTGTGKGIGLVVLILLTGTSLFAQEAAPATTASSNTIGGISSTSFYGLLGVVLVELIILMALVYNVRFLLQKEKAIQPVGEESSKINWVKFWDRINSLRPIKEEAEIDLGHSYDGIRELDNRLPPWWLYGFYACILFAVIYLWRFEVVHSAPSSIEEYTMAMKKGEEEKEAYLATSASKVDENSVTLITDASALGSAQGIFNTNCAPCHAADGGGLVGPNLTDDYWLHGGSVKDIFKTIKYGWQEKGMKSWKDDFTPVQIAQLSSYIISLRGKTPAKPKEPQGELYIEKANNDTAKKAAPVSDSLVAAGQNKK